MAGSESVTLHVVPSKCHSSQHFQRKILKLHDMRIILQLRLNDCRWTRCGNIVTFQSKPFRFPKNPLRFRVHLQFMYQKYLDLLHSTGLYLISYGIRVLTKTSMLLGGNELHAPRHDTSCSNDGTSSDFLWSSM